MNPEAKRKYMRQWHIDHPTHRKEYFRKARQAVLQHYGAFCVCCGETTYEFLALDHIAGGGNRHRKQLGSRWIYNEVKRLGFPPDYQVLCHNCNQAKGFYGQCPHENLRSILCESV
jgi:hypothetical protein